MKFARMNFFVFNLRILAIEITKLNFGAKNRKDFPFCVIY